MTHRNPMSAGYFITDETGRRVFRMSRGGQGYFFTNSHGQKVFASGQKQGGLFDAPDAVIPAEAVKPAAKSPHEMTRDEFMRVMPDEPSSGETPGETISRVHQHHQAWRARIAEGLSKLPEGHEIKGFKKTTVGGHSFWQKGQKFLSSNQFFEEKGEMNWPHPHEGHVRAALEAGKHVPAEVMAEYPHLAAKSPPQRTESPDAHLSSKDKAEFHLRAQYGHERELREVESRLARSPKEFTLTHPDGRTEKFSSLSQLPDIDAMPEASRPHRTEGRAATPEVRALEKRRAELQERVSFHSNESIRHTNDAFATGEMSPPSWTQAVTPTRRRR